MKQAKQGKVMSNVIDFLERMGQDAQLRHASRGEVELALKDAQIDSEIQVAILAKDQSRLEELLGSVNVCCMLEPSKEDESEDDDTEEQPSQGDEKLSAISVSFAIASVG